MPRRVRRRKRSTYPAAPPLVQVQFGRALRACREGKGESQLQLATLLDYKDVAMISMIERGLRAPSLWRAIQLALYCDTTVEVMCGVALPG